MNKKVVIVTYCHWKSIGSILQSYALSKTIEYCGYTCELWIEEWNRTLGTSKRTIKGIVKSFFEIPWKRKIESAYKKRMSFVSDYLDIAYLPQYEAFRERAEKNQECVYLAGSDQVWHPDQSSLLYFLDFVSNSKRISYAASMGKTEISLDKERIIGNALSEFEYISVREKACAKALKSVTSKGIAVHIDPIFLLEPENWRTLEKPCMEEKPYILVYMLYWEKACKDQIKALKKRTGLPVYAICPEISRVYADKYLYDVGVEEFLWLIDHAAYVITSSFHGAAFSILFNKRFAAVINPRMPSRIENVLEILSVPLVSIDALDSTSAFAYDITNSSIKRERERSIDYLKTAIG